MAQLVGKNWPLVWHTMLEMRNETRTIDSVDGWSLDYLQGGCFQARPEAPAQQAA